MRWGVVSFPLLFYSMLTNILGSTVAAGIVQQLVAEDMELLLAEKKTV
jgi:hypothetical protein